MRWLLSIVLVALAGVVVHAEPARADTPAAIVTPAAPGPLSWTAPRRVVVPQGTPQSISCPVVGFCVAVDQNNAFVYRHGRWSGPTYISWAGGSTPTVSCASVRYCLSTDGNGFVHRFDGQTWHPAVRVDDVGLLAISCGAESHCVVYDSASQVLVLDGTTVVGRVKLEKGWFGLNALSCASAVFCVVIDADGGAWTFDGLTWGEPTQVTQGGPRQPDYPDLVSCPSAHFCLVAASGQTAEFDGTSWSAPATAPGAERWGLSCAASTSCTIVAQEGNAYTWDGASWSSVAVNPTQYGLRTISCATKWQCVALNWNGSSFVRRGPTWGAPVYFDENLGANISGVSCSLPQVCVAVSGSYVVRSHGDVWSKPRLVGNEIEDAYPQFVSCVSRSHCVMLQNTGKAYVYSGGSWSGPTQLDPNLGNGEFISLSCPVTTFCAALTYTGVITWKSGVIAQPAPMRAWSVSCASSTFCVAVGNNAAWTFDGTAWSAPAPLAMGYSGLVSCPTTTFCLAMGEDGTFTFDGARWTPETPIGKSTSYVSAVSCGSPELCTALIDGYALTRRDGVWTAPVLVGSANAVSCVGRRFCVAVGGDGYVFVGR